MDCFASLTMTAKEGVRTRRHVPQPQSPPDDRLRRAIEYYREIRDRIEKPQSTGCPAFAEHDKMISPDLPAELKAALDAKLEGFSRSDAAARAAAISQTYRDGGGSGAIRSETDALAYALARMPATHAAAVASLNALSEIRPDFAPISLLDVGAGPGTATWAAAEAFPSLQRFTLLDANDALRTLALGLARNSARLRHLRYEPGQARSLLADAEAADLVIASYMIGEIGDAERKGLAEQMWRRTRDTLLIVEPGTPAGYARIIALRQQLIAAGAHVAAPCPHDGKCPLSAPDWCHFTQRLARSRAHKQVKGADVPFEDEKFAYVALTRTPLLRRPARVLAQPAVTKVEVSAKLCTPAGLTVKKVPRRAKADYAHARRWRWGDAVMDAEEA
jgi:ribosomal protein RSM22 (predicted rRNA methylase)